jgi:hypothetical protein
MIGVAYLLSKAHIGYAAAVILVLSALGPLAQAQPGPALSVAYARVGYLGGSITVNATLQNIASISSQVSRVEVKFDWNQTFTGSLKILQPGESYEWKFQDCPIPEHTWTGNHSFTTTFFVSWAQPTGNWSLEIRMPVTAQFLVEPPQRKPRGSIEEFLGSPYGSSLLLLFAAFLATVAATRSVSPRRRKTLQRVASAIVAAMGFPVLLYSVEVILHTGWTTAASFWVLQASWILAISIGSVQLILLHKRLWSISFGRALDILRPPPLAIGLSCFMLNFTLLTLEFLLPFREVFVTLLPFLSPAGALMPVSFTQSQFLLTTIGASFWVLLPGPAFLFGVRTLRRWNRRAGRGLSELLQAMFYASVLLALYSWYSGSTLSGESLRNYVILLAMFLFPGSLAVPLVFTLLPRKIASSI